MSCQNNPEVNRPIPIVIQKTNNTANMLAAGLLEIYEPHLKQVKVSLQELIAKQQKIFIDLSAEKSALAVNNIKDVENMMERAKIYKEKLIGIRKQMVHIHHRTQSLKKKAYHVQTCKEKQMASIIQKQLQEEALIGKSNSEAS